MINRFVGAVMAGGSKLAAQVVVSVIATGCAAVIVPQLLPKLGYQVVSTQAATGLLAAPLPDFEAAFAPHPLPQPVESALIDPPPAPVQVASVEPAPQSRPHAVAARACGRRCEARRAPTTAPAPQPRPGEPLELAAMIAPPPPAEPARPRVLGMTIPRIPFEDKVVDTVSMARSAVARVFN
jgi:hypothetical protein